MDSTELYNTYLQYIWSNIYWVSQKAVLFRDRANSLNCLPRPRIGVLHFPQVICSFDNALELIEMNLKKDNHFYQLHADGIVSLDLDFKMQFGNRLLYLILRLNFGAMHFSLSKVLAWHSFCNQNNQDYIQSDAPLQ